MKPNNIITGSVIITSGAVDATLAAETTKVIGTVNISAAQTIGVTGTFWQATQPVSGTFWQATQPVSGTVAATQSGTWNFTNISGTVSLPTGASTAAKQPALGTAGVPSTDVLSIQGIAGMAALPVDGSAVTQPVSGEITVASGWISIKEPDGLTAAVRNDVPDIDVAALVVRNIPSGTQTIIGTVGVTDYTGAAISVTGTFWQATQPVSLASVPSHNVSNLGTFAVQATIAAAQTLSTVTTVGTVTTVSTVTNLSQLGGTAIAMNTGTRSAGTQRVTIATDDLVPVNVAVTGSLTDRSGSITAGGTAQQLAAVNANRRYLLIINISTETLWINFTTTAVADKPSIPLETGDGFIMATGVVSPELVSIIGATTGSKFTAKEG